MSGFFVRNVWLIPFFPLLGAAVAAVGARQLRTMAHVPVVAGIVLAFLVSLGALGSAGAETTTVVSSWLSMSNLEVPIDFRVDGLTTMMLAMVTFVSSLVAIFAAGYMAGDPGYPRFFALIGLFVFSMTGLVLSNNYLLTYVFWEGVGACSYLLIGFWHTRPAAAAAAMKAFLVNRIGDFGFAVAIFWLWAVAPGHDLSYGNILSESTLSGLPAAAKVGIPLLLFWAATAKSAQIPLYVWLPDAMEGPTPVSALIHAATMVTAGVYLIARSMPLIRAGAWSTRLDRGYRLRHGALVGIDRTDSERSQARDGLFDGEPAWLHVHGAGRRGGQRGPARGRGGDVSFVHARLLQGAFVPVVGQCDARDGRRDRHAAFRRLAPPAAVHARHVRDRRAGAGGNLPVRGFFQQGRNLAGPQLGRALGGSVGMGLGVLADLLGGHADGAHDRLLRGPCLLHDVLGPVQAAQPR